MKKWMHILMLSCPRATELIEKSKAFRLSWVENARLFMHTRDILQKHHQSANHADTSSTAQDITALKQKIIKRLEEI